MDILERLRRDAGPIPAQCTLQERQALEAMEHLFHDAADEIERLKGERDNAERCAVTEIAKREQAEAQLVAMRAALESIAANTCCDKCQEAALVARQALAATDAGKTAAEVLAAAEACELTGHHVDACRDLSKALEAHRAATEKGDG